MPEGPEIRRTADGETVTIDADNPITSDGINIEGATGHIRPFDGGCFGQTGQSSLVGVLSAQSVNAKGAVRRDTVTNDLRAEVNRIEMA